MKICSKCRLSLPHDAFYLSKKSADGFRSQCKACHKTYAMPPEYFVAYHRKNQAAKIERASAWNRTNRDRRLEISKKARSRRRAARGVPYTAEQLRQRMAYFGFKCWMCAGPYETADHVKPIGKGGWDCLSNLRPACHHCNRSKQASWPVDLRVA